jgi:hypothetical protein
MAIAFVGAAWLGNGAGSITAAYSVGGNYLIVAVVAVGSGGADTVTACSYNGTAMNLLGKKFGQNWCYLFGLLNPSTGSHNVVVTATASLLTLVNAADYSGVGGDGTATPVTNSGSSISSLSTSITTVEDNCWCVMVGEGYNGGGAQTAGSGTTQRAIDTGFSANGIYDSNGVVHPAGSKTLIHQYGGSVSAMSAVLASLAPPATPATGDASITEAADTVSADASATETGDASITEEADTVTAAAGALALADASITEGADTLSAIADNIATGDASITEDADTISADASTTEHGDASITEGDDTVSADASTTEHGDASITEGDDTLSAIASVVAVPIPPGVFKPATIDGDPQHFKSADTSGTPGHFKPESETGVPGHFKPGA